MTVVHAGRLAFATALVLTTTLAAQATRPQGTRDAVKAPAPAGTGSIEGVVADQTSGSPLPRVAVNVSTSDGAPIATVYTDAQGQFTARALAAGRYMVLATKPAYVRAPYGARRFDRPGTPITVAEGQHVDGLKIAMARGGVISGSVTDDGQPIPDVLVRLSQYRTVDGERTLAPVSQTGGATSATTDDRGVYRIFGLPAGEYVVTASPRPMPNGDIRQTTPTDIQSVRQAIQAAAATAQTPGPKSPEPVTVTYSSVYYPGTTNAANATLVSVGPGEERNGVDMSMQLVRTAHIDGIVLTPPGVPPSSVQLLLVNATQASGNGIFALNRVAPGPDGKFSYSGVAPGQYTISARASVQGGNGANANVGVDRPGGAPLPLVPPGGQGPILWGQAEVSVSGDNVSGVAITLQPGMTISGRISADAIGVDAPDLTRARVQLVPASAANGISIGAPNSTVDASGHFTMTGVVPGRYRFSASLSTPEATWYAKSAILKGKDGLDGPIEIAPNDEITNAQVTFGNRTQEVSGHLQDASGRPATDYTIVLFPTDRAAWSSTRRVRTARPGTDGQFVIGNVPAGDYRMAAVVDVAPGETSDPAFLDEVTAASLAIKLGDGEKKVQDLRIK